MQAQLASPPVRLRFALLLLAGVGLWSSSCSDEASQEDPSSSSERSNAEPNPAQEQRVRPEAPERNFSDRRPVPGAWYQELVARVPAAQDGWLTEVVAEAVEGALHDQLQAALDGEDDAFARILWREFEGADPFRPAELEALEGAPFRVQLAEQRDAAAQAVGSADLPQAVRTWLEPLRACENRRVQVHATRIVAEPQDTYLPFTLKVQVRLAGDAPAGHPDGALQVQADWSMGWALGQRGKRLGIRWLHVESYLETLSHTRPLVDLTRHVFAEPDLAEELESGSLEFWKRVDRIAIANNVYLGMHGLGVGDIDGDGREDVYVAQQSGLPNRLWLAMEDGRFTEQGQERGVDFLDDTTGVLIVDLDGDGLRELALGLGSSILICWNEGGGRFPTRTRLGLEGTEQVYSISAADADGDGDLDLYATRYVAGGVIGGVPTPYHDANNGASNAYFANQGERTFVDATEEVGLGQNNQRFSLVSLWEDLEGDGDLDLYVANDFGRNNLYRNDGGTFVDVAAERGAEDMAAGMGISVADVDVDGHLDIYVSNMFTAAGARVTAQPRFLEGLPIEERKAYGMHTRGNTLLMARGDGRFEDVTSEAGVGPGGWAWGAMFTDFQNDGLPDIVVPNGFLTGREDLDMESFFWRAVVGQTPAAFPPTENYRHAWIGISTMTQREGYSWNGPERNYAYWNAAPGRWIDVSAAAGYDFADDARVACVLDHDGDGQLDVVMRNRTAPRLRFLHGRGASGRWCSIELVGRAPNTDAVGALVEVRAGERSWKRRRYAGEGYLGCQSGRLHFGLGPVEAIDEIVVTWPSGKRQRLLGPPLDRRLVVSEGQEGWTALEPVPSSLNDVTEQRVGSERRPSLWRVPLLDTMPMANLELPSFEGGPRKLSQSAPRSTLVVLWAAYDESCEHHLAQLAQRQVELREAGIDLHPLTLDEVADLDAAQRLLADVGLESAGGRLGRRARTIFEGLLVEVVGGFPDLPLPVGVWFDGQGHPTVLHIGGIDPDDVLRDSTRLQRVGRWPTGLTGGRWLESGPSRSLAPFVGFLRRAGFADLAQEIEAARLEREQ